MHSYFPLNLNMLQKFLGLCIQNDPFEIHQNDISDYSKDIRKYCDSFGYHSL